jgi:parallel beta-helix repeat protein
MKKGIFRKGLVFGILLLFVGAGIVPSTVGVNKEKTTIQTIGSHGYIQDLINNASEGDTIYVPSGIYYENIIINKSISLTGEDKNTTIIDGGNKFTVITIISDWVNISGFTIRNSGTIWYDAGIKIIKSNNSNIKGNNIWYNNHGIELDFSDRNNISNNLIISNNENGIYLSHASGNTIKKNTIISNRENGIEFYKYSINNLIESNNITLNYYSGICIEDTHYNTIFKNNIFQNLDGIHLKGSSYNIISDNTIDSNKHSGIVLGYHPFPPVVYYSFCNNIQNNSLSYNTNGIYSVGGDWDEGGWHNIIKYNNIIDNFKGLLLSGHNFTISNNNIIDNSEGLNLDGNLHTVSYNNFINNNRDAYFYILWNYKNSWYKNYWNKPRVLPKIIFGKCIIPFIMVPLPIPWFKINWRPAFLPNKI